MYSFYLNPTVYNTLTLDDYTQLQRVLAREQIERQRRYEQEAALKAYQEKIRIQNAIRQLQVITELRRQREREERAIQAYYLEKARREQEQIRQERERLYYQNYLNTLQNNCYERKPAVFFHPSDALASSSIEATTEEVSDNESEDEEDNRYNQLADIINLIFGVSNGAEQKEQERATKKEEEVSGNEEQVHESEEATEENEEKNASDAQNKSPVAAEVEVTENENVQPNNAMDVDQFMEFFSEKLKKFNEAEDLENEEKQKQAQLEQEVQEDESETAESNLKPLLEDQPEDQDMEEAEDFVSLAIQHIDDTEHVADDEASTTDEVPTLEKPENIVDLVNELASEVSQNNSLFPDEDPVKLAKYDALNRIEQELDEIQQKNENILRNSLDFDVNSLDSDTIYANTANNREFLGYEDQIMKVLLKLDMIESDGDEEIRAERKSLVKRAENMLETLDDFKHREWERVSNSSHCSDEEFEMA